MERGDANVPASAPGPFFTVIVTAYRRRNFVRGAVESVLDQTIDPGEREILVLKDFGDPELDAWLTSLGPSVRIVTEDLPLIGQMLARGAELARGAVLCFLDDDDRFRPEKLAGLRPLFRDDAGLGLVHNAFDAIDLDGRVLPVWAKYRPQTPTPVTFGGAHGRVRFPVVHHYGGYVNVSSLAVRTPVVRRWAEWLRQVPASQDVVLFTLVLASGDAVRLEPERWTEYRVHASTSHPTIGDAAAASDVRDFRKALVTADLLGRAIATAPGHPDAVRLSEAWRLETTTIVFLLDPTARLSPADWLRLGVSAVRRRQAYIATLWLYCLYRWAAPVRAAREYQARRRGELRRTAATAPSNPAP